MQEGEVQFQTWFFDKSLTHDGRKFLIRKV